MKSNLSCHFCELLFIQNYLKKLRTYRFILKVKINLINPIKQYNIDSRADMDPRGGIRFLEGLKFPANRSLYFTCMIKIHYEIK